MFECRETEAFGLKWLGMSGRIDAMSASDIKRKLDELMTAGDRVIGADLEKVNYISSAGLRVFLTAQKKLTKVGGEIVLAHVLPDLLEVFKMSGLDKLFRIAATREEACEETGAVQKDLELISEDIEGISITYLKKQGKKGAITVLGAHDKLTRAAYEKEDVLTVRPSEIEFGLGLGSLGRKWDHYKELFGEAMVIDHNFFFYPAVKNPAVDFMLCSEEDSSFKYRFLNGFGFGGAFHYVVSFEGKEEFVSLDRLIKALFQVSEANLLGILLLGESKGTWGMNLKRAPVKGLRPAPTGEIFDPAHIKEWVDMPVEPTFINHAIVGTGLVVRKKWLAPRSLRSAIPEGQDFHIHAGIFEEALFSNDPNNFPDEVIRILKESEVHKIQHLMGRSLFKSGVIGVVEIIEGETSGTLDRRP